MSAWWWMHPLAVVAWLGGGAALALVAWAGARGEHGPAVAAAARVALRALVVPGLLLAWAAGLLRFVDGLQAQHYAQAGWLHAKITVALLASGATGVLGATLRRAAEGGEHATRFRVLFLAHLLAAAAALWLLVARPF